MAAALSAGFCRHSSLDLQTLSMATNGRGLESVWRSRLNQAMPTTSASLAVAQRLLRVLRGRDLSKLMMISGNEMSNTDVTQVSIHLNRSEVGAETLSHCDQPSRNRLMCRYTIELLAKPVLYFHLQGEPSLVSRFGETWKKVFSSFAGGEDARAQSVTKPL